MSREVVNKSPTRKTLVTGESLPAVTDESRPIPLGRDEDGAPDSAVRAFAVLLRNRADSPVYVREGATDDENRVDGGEVFQIWEPNGTNNVYVRGENGGERVEFRTLEAHNDFSITDKIDAFARALSHFFGTATRSTTVETFSDTVTIDDITTASATFDVSGSVDIGNFADTVTIDDITSTSTTFDVQGNVDATGSDVTIGDITGQSTTLDIGGNVTVDDISTVSDTVTIDDITTASATFDGDITGQTDFELSVRDIEGTPDLRILDDSGLNPGDFDSQLGSYIANYEYWTLYSSAPYDGFIQRFRVRVFNSSSSVWDIGARLQINDGSGYSVVSPYDASCGEAAYRSKDSRDVSLSYFHEDETAYIYEPSVPIKFREGDGVRFQLGPNTDFGTPGNSYDIEVEVQLIERRGNT